MDRPRTRVLLISTVPTHPMTAGNRARVYALLEALETLGVDFHLAYITWEDADIKAMQARWGESRVSLIAQKLTQNYSALWRRIRNRSLRTLGWERFHPSEVDCYRSPGLECAILDIGRIFRPVCVLVEYVFNSWMLELFPASVRKVIDTHDKFANRYAQFLKAGVAPEWFSTTPGQERKGLRRADCVMAIQQGEADYFQQLSGRPVVTVGHVCRLRPTPEPAAGPITLLYIGSNNHANQDAMTGCLQEIWPGLHRQHPTARLLVAGGVCESLGQPPPGVELRGQVASLDGLYAAAHIVINPMRAGTGLKIKCLEALSHGKPLVTTPVGAAGLETGAGDAFLVGPDSAGVARHCLELMQSPARRSDLATRAMEFIKDWNCRQAAALQAALLTVGMSGKGKEHEES